MDNSFVRISFLVTLVFVIQNKVHGISPSLVMHPIDRAKEGAYPCGAIPMLPGANIVGGQISEPFKYPWLASLICHDCQANQTITNPWGHICGGSLITQR